MLPISLYLFVDVHQLLQVEVKISDQTFNHLKVRFYSDSQNLYQTNVTQTNMCSPQGLLFLLLPFAAAAPGELNDS